jgi:hypothetical protein
LDLQSKRLEYYDFKSVFFILQRQDADVTCRAFALQMLILRSAGLQILRNGEYMSTQQMSAKLQSQGTGGLEE